MDPRLLSLYSLSWYLISSKESHGLAVLHACLQKGALMLCALDLSHMAKVLVFISVGVPSVTGLKEEKLRILLFYVDLNTTEACA